MSMFRKLYHYLITRNLLGQLLIWGCLFVVVFVLLRLLFNDFTTDTLFHSMTSFDKDAKGLKLRIVYVIGVVFFSGFLVMILTSAVRNEIEKVENGDVRYRLKGHYVVFGYNDIAKGVLKSIVKKEDSALIVVVVENDVRKIRDEIIGTFGNVKTWAWSLNWRSKKGKRIIVLHGNRTSIEQISSFSLEKAKEIYIVGEEEIDIDFKNLDCYNLMSQSPDAVSWHAYIYLYLKEPSSITLLHNRNYESTTFKLFDFNHRLKIFNNDEMWARRILGNAMLEYPDMCLFSREGDRLTIDSEKRVHLIIFGMSDTGEMVAKTAAQICHFPNFVTKGIKTKITVIDEDFDKHRGILHGRYSDYMKMCKYIIKRAKDGNCRAVDYHFPKTENDFLDIEWEFIESIPDETSLQELLGTFCDENNDFLTVVVCNSDESKNASIALGLPKTYYDKSIPIWLYSKAKSTLADYLSMSRYSSIRQWGMVEEGLDWEQWDESSAKLLNYFYMTFDYKEMVDLNQIPVITEAEDYWERLSVEFKMNTISYLSGVPTMFCCSLEGVHEDTQVKLDDQELPIFAELEHIKWVTCRLLFGYRPLEKKARDAFLQSSDKSALREFQRKHFYHFDIVPYKDLRPSTQKIQLETIKFYMQVLNKRVHH